MVVAAYRIEINGRDLTETWRRERRLLSIDVTDKLGASADSCTLELDDRGPHIARPPAGAQLRLWLGATPESRCTSFCLNASEYSLTLSSLLFSALLHADRSRGSGEATTSLTQRGA